MRKYLFPENQIEEIESLEKLCIRVENYSNPGRGSWLCASNLANLNQSRFLGLNKDHNKTCNFKIVQDRKNTPHAIIVDRYHNHQTGKYLSAGGSNCTSWDFDIKTTFRVLLSPQSWVIEWLVTCFPVTHCLPYGLQNTEHNSHIFRLHHTQVL